MPVPAGGTSPRAGRRAHLEPREHDQDDHAEQGEYRNQGCQQDPHIIFLEQIGNINKREPAEPSRGQEEGLERAQSGCAEEVKFPSRGGLSRSPRQPWNKLMPKISQAEREAALARNGAVARALTTDLGWTAERAACLPPAVRLFTLYVPKAELLVAPWQDPSGQNVQSVTMAITVTRCDALAVGVGAIGGRRVGIYATVGLWGRSGPTWHPELRAWCSPAGGMWMAAQLHAEEAAQVAFRLTGARLRVGALPWANEHDRDAGFSRADDLLLREAR